VQAIVDRQDYLWFLALLGWTLAGCVHFWLRRRISVPAWISPAALSGFAIAGLQWSQIVTPVEIRPDGSAWLAWDVALGFATAVLASWWAWLMWERVPRGWPWQWIRLVSFALPIAAAGYRSIDAASGSACLAIFVTITGLILLARPSSHYLLRFAIAALIVAAWSGTTGPIAEWAHTPHRDIDLGVRGAWSALVQVVAATAVFFRQGQWIGRELRMSTGSGFDKLSAITTALVAWVLIGGLLAELSSRGARGAYEGSLLARARMAASLIEQETLERALGPEFIIETPQQTAGSVRAPWLATGVARDTATTLTRIEEANPDVLWAYIATLRNGWLVGCIYSSKLPGRPDEVILLHPVGDAEVEAWERPQAHLVVSKQLDYGRMLQVYAPLTGEGGAMLGWLAFDLSVVRWISAQAQARGLTFVIVGLGAVLLLFSWWLRQRTRQRVAAEREAASATEASRTKTAFLAKVSHELRTPIQSVLGYSELLLGADLGERQRGWLHALRQHGSLLIRLVNDLIDLGALETGAFRLRCGPLEIASLVGQSVESLRPRAESKGLRLTCVVEPTVPPWVEADGERLRQVTTNLVSNAIKFTDSGTVSVALGWNANSAASLRLIVRDTGPGIRSEDLGRLFQPFSRLEATNTKEGAGLGLALSVALCRAMEGDLVVESDGRTGSTFIATWKVQPCMAPRAEAAPGRDVTLDGMRVLIVDDNGLIRELFVASLAERGALCATCVDGESAMERVRRENFDVVVVDLGLPDISGLDLARTLKEERPWVRLVGVSAHASSEDHARALSAGMDAFLTKPVGLGELAHVIACSPTSDAAPHLESMADRRLRERLSKRFREDALRQWREIEGAYVAGDWNSLRRAAHVANNSASVVSDTSLADLCSALEWAAEVGRREEIDRTYRQCAEAFGSWISVAPSRN